MAVTILFRPQRILIIIRSRHSPPALVPSRQFILFINDYIHAQLFGLKGRHWLYQAMASYHFCCRYKTHHARCRARKHRPQAWPTMLVIVNAKISKCRFARSRLDALDATRWEASACRMGWRHELPFHFLAVATQAPPRAKGENFTSFWLAITPPLLHMRLLALFCWFLYRRASRRYDVYFSPAALISFRCKSAFLSKMMEINRNYYIIWRFSARHSIATLHVARLIWR